MTSTTISSPEALCWIALCGLMVFLSGAYSGAETGLYCLNRLRLNLHVAGRVPAAMTLHRLLSDQPGMLFTMLVGTNVTDYVAASALTIFFLKGGAAEHQAEFFTSVLLTPAVLVFGEILPKVLFERDANRLLLRFSWLLSASYRLSRLTGLIALQNALSKFVLRTFHREAPAGPALQSRLEMYHLLRESAAQGALTRTQLFMLERLHTLKATRVGTVMVPLGQVVMLSDTARLGDAIATVRACPYSRLPVYRGTRAQLVGVVHALDILTGPADSLVTSRLHRPVEVKYGTDVVEALSALQQRHRRMAFVVNEAGRCLGIVTVKDLVEEIVGELTAW